MMFRSFLLIPPVFLLSIAAAFHLDAQQAPPVSPAAVRPGINTALIPTPKLEDDSYDWLKRHGQVLALQRTLNPEIVLIGDSITHFWGGEPRDHESKGPKAWVDTFGTHRVLNMGFGWDRTQNVLWRLDHGELNGIHPRTVVLNIGTNNFTTTAHARANSPEEIAQAIEAICARVQSKCPGSRLIVMGVFPRGNNAHDDRRPGIKSLNTILSTKLAGKANVSFLDLGPQMMQPDGSITNEMMPDGTHPGETGYAIWGKALIEAGALR